VKPLFEVKKVDANFYEAYLRDFLPDRIVDCHSHVWCQSMLSPDPLALSRTPLNLTQLLEIPLATACA
jgi:hypothetical protein